MINFSFIRHLKCRNPTEQFHARKWIEIMVRMFVTVLNWHKSEIHRQTL